jgi:ubiquinone biosynthesis monooxygenase Coq7
MSPHPDRDALTIKRRVRVNHAGEFGAIRIYSAQILVARGLCPDTMPKLTEMLGHEREHCKLFFAAMPARGSRPCQVMQFWSWGGWLLGFLTALMGRQGVWACTAAVEETVHHHLDDQMFFLRGRDPELHHLIESIRAEELAHLQYAEQNLMQGSRIQPLLHTVIGVATGVLIWLSTWGDSARMARALKRARLSA